MKMVTVVNFCFSTFGWLLLIQLQGIECEILADVLDNVGSGVADIVNDITTGSTKTTKICGMNTVK